MLNEARYYLYTQLKTLSGIGDRAYPDYAPRGTALPFIVYQLEGDEPDPLLAAIQPTQDFSIRIRIYSARRIECTASRDALKALLDPVYNVALGNNIRLADSYIDGFIDDFEELPEGRPNVCGAFCAWRFSLETTTASAPWEIEGDPVEFEGAPVHF